MEGIGEIRERLARLEYAEERASADREEMRAEIKAIGKDLTDIKDLLMQVKGGAKVAWVAYAIIGSFAGFVTWLASKFVSIPLR